VATSLWMAIREEHEKLLACVHCGLCLPQCPTYTVLGDENDSPRGRLYLMRAVAEGRIEPGAKYTQHVEACILCRACETACPSGVRFAHIMETARADLRRNAVDEMGWFARSARWIGLHLILPNRLLLKPAVWPMRLIRHLRPRNGWSKRLPKLLRVGLEMLPPPPVKRPSASSVPTKGERRVILFRGCIMDELYHDVNEATARVLTVNGCIVEIPSRQGCCGSLHEHSGFKEKAKELARNNIDALEDGSDAPIIVNAAGCGALLKEYGELLWNDPDYAERAKRLSARVKDVTEFLSEGEVVAGVPTGRRVTWDAPCHLYHAQRVQAVPLKLFHAIPDLKLVPLPGFDRCCGSGGIYNLTHPDIAEEVLAEKLSAIRETGVDTVVTANPGCQMQIQAGLRAAGIPARVAHVVELLDESYAAAGLYERTS